jgi:hypothetical protein
MENWKDIKDYEGIYQVSDLGNVKSLDRYINCNGTQKHLKGKLKKPSSASGYCLVHLHKNGIISHQLVHRLVAKAFIPNPEDKLEVNHIDHNRKNNKLSNLEWVTKEENMQAAANFYYGPKEERQNSGIDYERPAKEELYRELIETPNFVALGRKYNVSDNAIRKWCKKYGLPYSTSYYKAQI